MKLNIDAAIFQDMCIGVGIVLRDSRGKFIRGHCKRMVGVWQPREVEALSLKEVLSWQNRLIYIIVLLKQI